jgi:hypothetical protein
MYRSARSTLGKRIHKKLTEKTTWYRKRKEGEKEQNFVGLNANGLPDEPLRKRKRSEDDGDVHHHQQVGGDTMAHQPKTNLNPHQAQESTDHGKVASKAQGKIKKIKAGKVEKKKKKQPEIKTVVFVPQTANSMLAKMLRQDEEHLVRVTGYRVKYVEKPGQNLGSQLVRSNPWSGMDCGRLGCLLCETKTKTGKNLNQSCSKRNLTYQTWCNTCKERDEEGKGEEDKKKVMLHTYIGETAKSAHERGREHVYDMTNLSLTSHMLKHVVDMHEGEKMRDVDFRMRVIKFHRSSFERQVSEAVSIQSIRLSNNLLNSKSEFNRSAVPRLALKMGSRNVVEDRQKEAEEEEQEKTIIDKIKTLRRLAGKRRSGGARGGYNANPAPKRRKVDENNKYTEENAIMIENINPNLGEKRKTTNEDDEKSPKAKKRRKAFQQDIRMFVKPSSIYIENVASNENDRVQKAKNNLTNKIDCRITTPKAPETAEHKNVANEENVSSSKNEVNQDSGLGTAPLAQIVTEDVTGVIGFVTVSPRSTQCVASGENVANSWRVEDLKDRLGTAPLRHIVTGDVTSRVCLNTASQISTQDVANEENVSSSKNDVNQDIGLGTAPLAQTVTEDVTGMIGFDTVSPRSTQGVASGEHVFSKNEVNQDSGLGTAPLTQIVTEDVTSMIGFATVSPRSTQGVAI